MALAQKETKRTNEQISEEQANQSKTGTESIGTSPHVYGNLVCNRGHCISEGKRKTVQSMVQNNYPKRWKKIRLGPHLIPHTKINSR